MPKIPDDMFCTDDPVPDPRGGFNNNPGARLAGLPFGGYMEIASGDVDPDVDYDTMQHTS